MKRILLPTDFSANAQNAICYAIELLSGEECKFFLLNTYTPVLYDNEYLTYSSTQPTLTEIYRNKSLQGLERVRRKILRKYNNENHEFELFSSFNLLSDEIKEIVKEREIDLVVMGTKGATGAEEILFGTHTVHAIKKTRCPLLAIPAHFEYHSPKNILFPTDFEVEIPEGFKVIKEVVHAHRSSIHVLHVASENELSEDQLRRKKSLHSIFDDKKLHFYNIYEKSVTGAIFDFTEENEIDMLVMVNNKHSFFENLLFRPVINEISFNVKVPFLVIPSK